MRASNYLLATLKETPADAEVISHQLMLRAGLIRRLASGLYTWLPLGLKTLRKVEAIVREEMNAAHALEVTMPVAQPSEIWKESARWEQYGPELLRFKDRHQREFCLGPTHEEVMTHLVRDELSSYKQLPITFYQIQTKFRDEIRPRFGVMRSREFIMKDAYSFHSDNDSLTQTYQRMHQAYCNIFDRIGLNYRPVDADSGNIGGNLSHEFHVLADSGEDAIVFSNRSSYAANIETAEALAVNSQTNATAQEKQLVATPAQKTIDQVANFLKADVTQCVKTLIVEGSEEGTLAALVLRGDHQLNEIKAAKLEGVSQPLVFATEQQVQDAIGCDFGSIGPIALTIPVIADRSAEKIINFVCGANSNDQHWVNANWQTDVASYTTADIRNVVQGDPSPCGEGTLQIKRGIEVGHIFQLGDKYSEAMNATVLNESGKAVQMQMGCYGIGVTRIVAAAIEQNHDGNGIIWPAAIAPFTIALVPINIHSSEAVKTFTETLYDTLVENGHDVMLMDQKKARLGNMLANTELMGIPHRLVIGDRGLEKGQVEYRARSSDTNVDVSVEQLNAFLVNALA